MGEEAPPRPPVAVEMRAILHCEKCALKVKKEILKRFDGVKDVIVDSKAQKVLVKGKEVAANPMKLVERVQKMTGCPVELLALITPPPRKPKEKETPMIAVVLKLDIHCEDCARGITKRTAKMKGVQSVEADLKASEVTVKGVFEVSMLVEFVYKRTGKQVTVVKSEPVPLLDVSIDLALRLFLIVVGSVVITLLACILAKI